MTRYIGLPLDDVLAQNAEVASPFHAEKTKRDAAKNWNRFYKQHRDRFFKDRHWTTREFRDLADLGVDGALDPGSSDGTRAPVRTLLEVGCGTGNCLYPLLERFPNVRCHACDFSQQAIDLVTSHPSYRADRINAFVYDLTVPRPSLRSLLTTADDSCEGVDVCTCLFVLSAVPPEKAGLALASIASTLRPRGVVLFRDYALHDSAQLRFHTRSSAAYAEPARLDDKLPLYRRADQTMSYFFTTEEVVRLFADVGLAGDAEIVTRTLENRKEGLAVERRFVQGRFCAS